MRKSWLPWLCSAAGLLAQANPSAAVPAIEKRDMYVFDELARYQQDSIDVLEDYDDKHVFWWAPFFIAPKLRPNTTKPFVSYRAQPIPSATAIVTFDFIDPGLTEKVRQAVAQRKGLDLQDVQLKPLPLDRFSVEMFTDLTDLADFQKETRWKNETSFFPATIPLTFPVSDFELKLLQQKQANFVLNARVQFAAKRSSRSISRKIDTSCVLEKIDEMFYPLEDDARESKYMAAELLILLGGFQQCVTETVTFDTDLKNFSEAEKTASWIDYVLQEKLIERLSADGKPVLWRIGLKADWQKFFGKADAMFLKEFPADVQDYDFRIGTMIRQ